MITKPTDTPAQRDRAETASLGLWIYLMTDVVLFGCLFATYAVLRNNTVGGPTGAELFDLPFILVSTLLLLTSSFTSGLAMLALSKGSKKVVLTWLSITVALGITFLFLEFHEFSQLIAEGNSWQRNAFLSSFFTLVATHGIHIIAGLIWALTLMWQVARRGFTVGVRRRLPLFSMFWHFLDVIWIFIFTLVYLMGAVQL